MHILLPDSTTLACVEVQLLQMFQWLGLYFVGMPTPSTNPGFHIIIPKAWQDLPAQLSLSSTDPIIVQYDTALESTGLTHITLHPEVIEGPIWEHVPIQEIGCYIHLRLPALCVTKPIHTRKATKCIIEARLLGHIANGCMCNYLLKCFSSLWIWPSKVESWIEPSWFIYGLCIHT